MTGGRGRAYRWLALASGVLLVSAALPGEFAHGRPRSFPGSSAAISGTTKAAANVLARPHLLERTVASVALGREMPYTVYLPPDYDVDTSARYPVLYMLHGLGGDHVIEWRAYGLFDTAESLIRAGRIEPLIIVLPEGEDGYWMDHAGDGPAWGTYVARDVVDEIDAHFRTIPRAEARAVGGNSMGGHGAIQLAMNFPARFGVVGIHSPTLRSRDEAPAYFGDADYFSAHDPASLARRDPASARQLRIWMDVGEQDPWLAITMGFHQELLDLGIPHGFRVLPGIHDDGYWTANREVYLEFYAEALRQGATGG